MPKTWCCPYFSWEDGLTLHCEGGCLRFNDAAERRSYVYRYCADVPGYQECTIAQNITKRYERSESDDEKRGQNQEPGA